MEVSSEGTSRKKVVVVGGGISGLATAFFLKEFGDSSTQGIECVLVEKENRLGGKIVTDVVEDLIIEGGPDSFLTLKPQALDLCERLGLSELLIGTNREKAKAYVLCRGKLRPLPEGVTSVVPSKVSSFLKSDLLSVGGKLRMFTDVLIPARREQGDEALASFVRRRLGQEALDRIAAPLMAGIYAGDPELLSMSANFPQLVALEAQHRSLILGTLAKARKEEKKSPRSRAKTKPTFMTLKGGLGVLVDSIVSRLQDSTTIITGTSVVAISVDSKKRYTLMLEHGDTISADVVVLATPSYTSGALLENINPRAAEVLKSIPYASTATISLAYDREGFSHQLNGSGFVIVPSEKRKITACTWVSSKWPDHSPEDRVLLRCYLGKAGQEGLVHLPDSELCEIAQDELCSILGIRSRPILMKVHRFKDGLPQYNLGHLQKLEEIEDSMRDAPGIFLTGAYHSGVGLPDCIKHACAVASKVLGSDKEKETELVKA